METMGGSGQAAWWCVLLAATVLIAIASSDAGLAADSPYGGDCSSVDCHGALTERAFVHSALEDGDCTDCHEEGDAEHRFTLAEEGRELCLLCHDEPTGTRVHPPAEDDCTDCHDPHGSPYRAHLLEAYPAGNYAPWSEEAYALCFDCHDSEMITAEFTEEATQFRDGSRNLHFVHVKREKGRNCLFCHDPHAGDARAMIRSSSPFGKWEIGLAFEAREDGASCAVSCHRPRSYSRLE